MKKYTLIIDRVKKTVKSPDPQVNIERGWRGEGKQLCDVVPVFMQENGEICKEICPRL